MVPRNTLLVALPVGLGALAACGEVASEPALDSITPTLATAGVGSWTPKPPLPGPRTGPTAAVVQNPAGQYVLYAIGGTHVGLVNRVDAYNATTGKWSGKAPMPSPRFSTNGAAVIAGRIYVSGGGGPATNATKTLYVYTAATSTWARRADLPVPSSLGVTVAIGGKFYVAWGSSESVDVYDPTTNRWTSKLGMSYGEATHGPANSITVLYAAGVVYNQMLLAIGGQDFEQTVGHTIAYDPATNTWTSLAGLGEARQRAAAGRVRDVTGRLQVLAVSGHFNPPGFDDENVYFGESEAFTQ